MKKIIANALLMSHNNNIMKITIFAFLLSFSISNAQFNIGIRGGLTLSNQELSTQFENFGENKYSPYLGIIGEYRFGKIAVASDITYLNLGSTGNVELRNNFDAPSTKQGVEINLNTISLNVLGKYYFTDEFNIGLGGYYGYIFDAEFKPNSTFSRYFKDSDFGLVLGAEYRIYKELFIEGRYSYGLTNIFENPTPFINNQPFDPVITSSGYSVKNRFLNIGLGYRF